ncbi:MAG: pyridoxamine 5'-phosphate oxidase [Bacteroidales bacterium]|nr:pyridoxamine 5'-phosphate oxidase [Bacteroidales bacterium]
MNNIQELRQEYIKSHLNTDDLHPDPFTQFRYWFNDAIKVIHSDANAMMLATADQNGKPSARMLLLKGFDQNGFTFFTNYESRKGQQLAENPYATMVFYWKELERQVRIEGRVDKTSRKESDEYFNIRPEGSKIGAWASPQSKPIPDRHYLDRLQHDLTNLFRSKPLERPENWGGYRLMPNLFEFWQGRENRLHDRFEYLPDGGEWIIRRLAP